MRVDVGGVQLEVLGYFEGALEGDRSKAPLLLLHGFTGSAAGWWDLLPGLGEGRAVFAPDLLGHAGSDAPQDVRPYAFVQQVRQLEGFLDVLQLDRVDVVGYGLGGRLALALALATPTRTRRLVLESSSAGIRDPKEREARRAEDEGLAASIEREGVESFAESWMAQPLFASQARRGSVWLSRARAERLRHTAHGLANSLRGAGQGAMPPLWERLREVRCPVLLVTGELDATYGALMGEMAKLMADARPAAISDAGHAVHAERPDAFLGAILPFLDEP